MSLSLLQGYSSAEDEPADGQYADSSDEEASQNAAISGNHSVNNSFEPLFDPPNPSSSSTLPSALDAFSEIAGPPQFLNNCVEEPALAANDGDGQPWRNGRRRNRKEKKDLPAVNSDECPAGAKSRDTFLHIKPFTTMEKLTMERK